MVKVGEKFFHTLIDTGSEINGISDTFYEEARGLTNILELPATGVFVKTAVGTRSQKISKRIRMLISLNQIRLELEAFVIPKLIMPLILGSEFFSCYRAEINYVSNSLTFSDGTASSIINFETRHIACQVVCNDSQSKFPCIQNTDLTDEENANISKLLSEYNDIFSEQPGCTHLYTHEIVLLNETPFVKRSYPVPFPLRKSVELELQRMTSLGVIKRATSCFASPMTVVKKKDDSVRICLDARHLNAQMVNDIETPIPIEELLYSFKNIKFLSVIDLTASYWQIPLTEKSQKYTCFTYNGQSYVYTRLPFGLKTAVASFSRGLKLILGPEIIEFTLVYVDDLLVYSKSFSEHIFHLKLLFERLKSACLTVNLKKCQFLAKQVLFLGHIISSEGFLPDPKKMEAIQSFPVPKKVKDVRAFLGLCNFYRRFKLRYSKLTDKLNTLLKKDVKWHWGDDEQSAFEEIKKMFLNTVMLHFPNYEQKFILETDSSNYGMGGVLYQEDGEEKFVISFYSKMFKGPELKYTTTEKELLAIINCLKKFKTLILGIPITIRSDHQALKFLKPDNAWNDRIVRWMLFIQQFNYELEHIRGTENVVADILSRNPVDWELSWDLKAKEFLISLLIGIDVEKFEDVVKTIPNSQEQDDFVKKTIINMPQNENITPHFEVRQGILYKKGVGTLKIVVPKHLVPTIIKSYHEELGHFGSRKVLLAIKRHLWWKGMTQHIKNFSESCELCQKAKYANRTTKGFMKPVIPSTVGELVAVDFFGPLPASTYGMQYIFVVLDVFSKFVKLYPLRKATTNAALKKLEDFNKIIAIKTVLSDHGSQFTSKKWLDTLKTSKDIRATLTSIRHPASNPAERVMREVGRLLRTYCHGKHTGWFKYIEEINEILNLVEHESTGFSAKEIVFPENCETRLGAIICQLFPVTRLENVKINDEIIRNNLLSRAEKRKRNYDRFLQKPKFHIGDMVLLKTPTISKAAEGVCGKLNLIYTGPFKITNLPFINVAELTDITGKRKGNFNFQNIKLFK